MNNLKARALGIVACLFCLGLTGQTGTTSAQEKFDVKAHYDKFEYRIPMRDGVKLFTSVYVPKNKSEQYPILLNRTPYSVRPYGPEYKESIGPSEWIAKEGYIIVYQDVRGRVMSEGEFMDVRPHNPKKSKPTDIDESSDTYDTIDWLIKNIPGNNGRVGMWGISYPGFYAAMGMIDAHPALKAVSPQAPIADWFIGDDFHHNGAFFLPHAFNFYNVFGRPRPVPTQEYSPGISHGTPDGYKFFLEMGPLAMANEKFFKGQIEFWNQMMAHPNYDEFWQARNTRPHLRNIKPAVMTVGGWYDAEDLFGALETYKATERQSPGAYNILVMGPWFHGGWARSDGDRLGDARFNLKTSLFYRESIELPFFNHYLKGKGSLALPEAYVFETGSNRWRTYSEWPPRQARVENLYLGAEGRLAFAAPTASAAGFDEYVSDPAKPVPFIEEIAIGMTREYMVDDQRFASRRPDVLTYQTEALNEDVTLAGPITASLFVSTSGTDSDFIVKIIDVYPDDAPVEKAGEQEGENMGGYQMLVRGEPFRARFRKSFSRPEPMRPNQVEKVEFNLPDVNHTFLKGHRIMVQIQSTWFPLVDRNPQKFVDIRKAKPSDFQKAVQRVHRSSASPSHIRLSILPAGAQAEGTGSKK
jgi:putative CocE/NonD family hydrolase